MVYESTRNVLKKFMKEHAEEWWSPHEINKERGGDIRTVLKGIRSLIKRPGEMTYRGWKLEVAERGDRIYAVRMVRDVENSRNLIKDEVSEVEGKRTRLQISSQKEKITLDNFR